MSSYEYMTTIMSALAIILPVIVTTAHKFGYEIPFLSKLSDFISARPKVALRKAAKK